MRSLSRPTPNNRIRVPSNKSMNCRVSLASSKQEKPKRETKIHAQNKQRERERVCRVGVVGGVNQPSRQGILAKNKTGRCFMLLKSHTYSFCWEYFHFSHSASLSHHSFNHFLLAYRMSRHPEVLWAQRSDKVYLTVALPDAKDVSVKCEPRGLFTFTASGVQGESYSFTLELYGTISPEGCKTKFGLRNILCSVQKAQKGWWKRLLKSEEKPAPYLKVDWHRWCDEDDEESSSDLDDDARFVGQDDGSSDEDGMLYLPDLEKARV